MPDQMGEVLVLDPAVHTPEIECYRLIESLNPLKSSYHLPALKGFASLDVALEKNLVKGVILLGSSVSVYEGCSWQSELEKMLKHLVSARIPILGICYGHQLLGYMYGAKIFELSKKQLGSRKVDILANSRFCREPLSGNLVVSHREVITALPAEFEVWAQSDSFAFEGIKHKNEYIWGIQAHPEATKQFCLNQNISYPTDYLPDLEFGWKIIKDFLLFSQDKPQ